MEKNLQELIMEHEPHVSLDIANLLKQAGFDWNCQGFYKENVFYSGSIEYCSNYHYQESVYAKAPSFYVAQRWLREVKNIDIDIHALVGMLHIKVYVPYISTYRPYVITESDKHFGITEEEAKEKNWLVQTQFALTYDNDRYPELPAHKYFYSYEEAQEAGIRKALEIILGKRSVKL